MLPLRFQGLGTGGWLGLTRWGFPTQFRQLTNATENSFRLQVEIGVADFAARTIGISISPLGSYFHVFAKMHFQNRVGGGD